MKRCNIGCGQSPTQGWFNYDNSLSLRLSRIPLLATIFSWLGFLDERQKDFIKFARNYGVMYADATRKLPLQDKSVDVLYTSHMVEHLDREGIKAFLQEALLVLKPNGIIRIAFPDVKIKIRAL